MMVATLFAGMRPTADQLNEIGKIGAQVASVSATSDSANSFNSATKVFLGLTASFTAPASATYHALAVFTWACATASNQEAFGLVWRQGTVVVGDPLAGASGPRSHPDGSGFNVGKVLGVFTTASAGTHEVGLIGWKPTGNTGVSNLQGDALFAINRLVVTRVG
jgi:hypothetical protein